MQYFGEYVLGWRGPSGRAAILGTMAHKVLELLAKIKLAQQDNKKVVEDDELKIKLRVNKYDLNKILEKSFGYYSIVESHHAWSEKDFQFVCDTVQKALTYQNGVFDPRTRDIVSPELKFDIEIKKPEFKYKYIVNDETLEGYFKLVGTIDLVTRADNSTIEVIDWKSGASNKDWSTGRVKDFDFLQQDPQLMIYHYAISKLFPQYKNIIMTIFFINAGGPISVFYSKDTLLATEHMLLKKMEHLKQVEIPKLTKSFKCKSFCHLGKTTFEGTNVLPIIERRERQVTPIGQPMTKCEQIYYATQKRGIEAVMKHMVSTGHSEDSYHAPGTV
jgi:ATP-dependent helicase/DNAse subunit B